MPEPAQRSTDARLLLVSNRLPLVLQRAGKGWRGTPAAGGLATGLSGPHRESQGIWIGWPGIQAEGAQLEPAVEALLAEHGMRGVPLGDEEHDRYYTRACNRCIWPLLHYFTEKVHFDEEDWEVYRTVNERFAQAVIEEARPTDLVFVQDFHLMLVPALVRAARPELRIGFFLHVPFPSSEIFRIFPPRAEVLRGLLGADVVAFHTLDYLRHFRAAVRRVLGMETLTSSIELDGRSVRLMAEPLGIDAEGWQRDSGDPEFAAAMAEMREAVAGRRLILGVERLDYTKGVPERLRAFRELLKRDPARAEQVVMVQVAVPSRTEAEEYRDLKDEVDRLVGEINGEFGRPGMQPLHYQFRGMEQVRLNALYRMADVAVVTPLRDGLNLVAKEYVASRTADDGVLVLGEFCGAAWELGEALVVNPFDQAAMVETLERALAMPAEEQATRMGPMRQRVREEDVHVWSQRCLRAISEAQPAHDAEALQGLSLAAVEAAWRAAASRVLFLDYDGTLRDFTTRPEDARPDEELLELLSALSVAPGTQLWLVSGRPQDVLEAWLGEVGAGLVAEHGAFVRRPGAQDFEPLLGRDPGHWRPAVRAILEQVSRRVPGSLVEEKPLGLAWHYRASEPTIAAGQARELSMHLTEVLSGEGLDVLRGNKVIEVRPTGITKGVAAEVLLAERGEPEFLLAAGDDVTDEGMLRALAGRGETLIVGSRESAAQHRLASPAALRAFLGRLLDLAGRS